jgi:hypothetical protein
VSGDRAMRNQGQDHMERLQQTTRSAPICRLLDFIAEGRRQAISSYLQQRFDELAL